MMKTFFAGAALVVATTFSAWSADLPTRTAPVYVPPPPPLWTGPFVGIGVGGVFGGDSGNSVSDKALFCSLPSYCNSATYGSGFGFVNGGGSSDPSFAVGGQAGFNYQIPGSQFVIGVVGDFTWLDRSSSRAVTGPKVRVQNEPWEEQTFYYDTFKQDWLATARVRAGVAFDNLLVFATGGLAFGNLKSTARSETIWTPPPPNPSFPAISGSGSTSGTATGWAVGGGLEYRIAPNWSLFAEYLYYSLDDSYTVTVTSVTSALPPGSRSFRVNADASGSIVRVGVNYQFWAPPAPVPYVAPVISVRN